MANNDQLNILQQGVDNWNAWRHANEEVAPDLSGANLQFRDLREVNFSRTNLSGADLTGADLWRSNCMRTNFLEAILSRTNFTDADIFESNLDRANLSWANFTRALLQGSTFFKALLIEADLCNSDANVTNFNSANLTGADLSGANLTGASFVGSNLRRAKLNDCRVYGISAWDVEIDGSTDQSSLIITQRGEPDITVDNLKVAQFIYLLLDNEGVRDIIDTVARKVVLVLGRFTPRRKAVLNAIRDELRRLGYTPVMFDFDKPADRSYKETVATLAHLSRFVIADLTDAKVILQELQIIVPHLTSVPIQPILQASSRQNVVIKADYSPYPWYLLPVPYRGVRDVIISLEEKVIRPAEEAVGRLARH